MLNPNKLGLDYSKPKKHRDAKIIYIFCVKFTQKNLQTSSQNTGAKLSPKR